MWFALTRSLVQMDWLRRNTAARPMAEMGHDYRSCAIQEHTHNGLKTRLRNVTTATGQRGADAAIGNILSPNRSGVGDLSASFKALAGLAIRCRLEQYQPASQINLWTDERFLEAELAFSECSSSGADTEPPAADPVLAHGFPPKRPGLLAPLR
jgi:hypothetical protein